MVTNPGGVPIIGLLCLGSDAQIIAGGIITLGAGGDKAAVVIVDTQDSDASDDLDTISGGDMNAFLIVQAAHSARTVVLKDAVDNLALEGDCSLDNAEDTITLLFNTTLSKWCEVCRSNNGA